MTIQHLIELLERRIANLSQLKTSAEAIGDVDGSANIEAELSQTLATINQLRQL
jgi:hypothetical protein